jgi:hypothetical protein
MKYSEIPLVLLMLFTLVYTAVGDQDSEVWSGLYFFVNYLTQLWLFNDYKNKIIRIGGISLNISILIYVVLKYFLHLEVMLFYTLIPFTICLITLIRYDYVTHKR